MIPHPDQNDIDPYETEEYQQFLTEMSKHCRCKQGVCGGILAGGHCDEIGWDDDNGFSSSGDNYLDDQDYHNYIWNNE